MNDVRGGTQWGCIKLSHPLVARHSLPSSCQTALSQPWVVACNKAWAVYNVLNVMRCLLFYYPARSVIYSPVCESTHPDCVLWCGSRTRTYKPVADPETQVLSGIHCKHIYKATWKKKERKRKRKGSHGAVHMQKTMTAHTDAHVWNPGDCAKWPHCTKSQQPKMGCAGQSR